MALAELTPDLTTYLGRAARLQLSLFETAAHAVATAPDIQAKDALSPVAQLSLDKYRALVAELEHTGHDPASAMEPFSTEIDTFRVLTTGSDWYELLVTAYVTAALLDDFFLRLSEGLTPDQHRRIAAIMRPEAGSEFIVKQLERRDCGEPAPGIPAGPVGPAAGGGHPAHRARVPHAACDIRCRRNQARAGVHRTDRSTHQADGRARTDRLRPAGVLRWFRTS